MKAEMEGERSHEVCEGREDAVRRKAKFHLVRSLGQCLLGFAVLFLANVLFAGTSPAPKPLPCAGDCDGNDSVTAAELVTGVNVALDRAPLETCRAFDASADGRVTVDEVVTAVHAALAGCPPFPLGAYFWPDHAFGQTGSALGDLAAFGLNTVVAYYEYVKPDAVTGDSQPDCHELASEAEALGVDFFIGAPRGTQVRPLDDAALAARLQATVDCVGVSPRYRGWMIDEPELTGYDAALLARFVGILRGIDPRHRVWVNFPPFATDEQVRSLGAMADILGFDIYPVREGDGSVLPNLALTEVGALTQKARDLAPPAAEVWMILQAFGYSDLPNEGGHGRRPTPQELRFMVYDALLHGARGITFFGSHQLRNLIPLDEPVWDDGVRRATRELGQIGSVTHRSEPVEGVSGDPAALVVAGFRAGEEEIVIAANGTDAPVAGTIRWDTAIADAYEIFDQRRPDVATYTVRDDFDPYGVHVYRITRFVR